MSGTTIVGARGARVSSFACSLVGSWRSQRRCRQSRMALIFWIERRLRRRAASKMWAIPVDAFSVWHGVAPPLLGAVRVPHHDWPFNRSDSSATLEGSKLLHRLGQSSSLRRPLGFRVIPCSRGTTQDVAVVDEKHLRMVLTAARSSRRIFLEGQACRARRRRGMGQKTRTRWGMARDLRAMAIPSSVIRSPSGSWLTQPFDRRSATASSKSPDPSLRRACRCDEERSLSALSGPLERPCRVVSLPARPMLSRAHSCP